MDRHLKAPSLGKLLFISPPPSPPCGWEIKEEEPPNKAKHAADLQEALAGLNGRSQRASKDELETEEENYEEVEGKTRSRSSTTVVYHPKTCGDSEDLPAVMVEDTTGDNMDDDPADAEEIPIAASPAEGGGRVMTHTARPPVELMEE